MDVAFLSIRHRVRRPSPPDLESQLKPAARVAVKEPGRGGPEAGAATLAARRRQDAAGGRRG